MLRVDRIVLREIRLPLREPFRISSGVMSERRIMLLQLCHPDGPEVWSECVAGEQPNYSSETIDTAWLMIRDWLADRVLGRDFADPRDIAPALDRGVRGHRMAKAAIEMGGWALAATLADQPLARVLGGTRERIDVGISLGIQASPEALVRRATDAVALGYRRVKLKIGPGADIEYVAAVRAALGDEAILSVDANAAYSPRDTPHLRQLDPLGLAMIEQPFEAGDLVRHAALQRELSTPLCLDESITSATRAEDMIQLDSGRIINIKPGRVGGFNASLAIHDICARADLPVWCGGMLESGVGRSYNVALASLPNFRMPGDLSPSARYWERDVVTPEWSMDAHGHVRVPLDRPGIGVAVDTDRVADLTVRTETLRAR